MDGNFLTKFAQIFRNFGAALINITFKSKQHWPLFGLLLEENWLHLISTCGPTAGKASLASSYFRPVVNQDESLNVIEVRNEHLVHVELLVQVILYVKVNVLVRVDLLTRVLLLVRVELLTSVLLLVRVELLTRVLLLVRVELLL